MQKYKTKKVSERNKVFLNMFANVLSFVVSLVISFFLTPYITSSVGTEAYGLVQKFLNKWTIFLFCSILFSSNQKEH